jgi:DNA polymerase-3 subunit epsilon
MFDFIAFDFETADAQNSAPCSIGITLVEDGEVVFTQNFLINPEAVFSPFNIAIHGIRPEDVLDSPTFPEVWAEISYLFERYPAVAHNAAFDKGVLEKAAARYGIKLPKIKYYCTCRLLQKNYPHLQNHKLNTLCEVFGIELNHHDSGSDCLACAKLMLILLGDKRNEIYSLYGKSSYNKDYRSAPKILKEPDVAYDDANDIRFDGSVFVVTGEIDGLTREQVFNIIRQRGGTVSDFVTVKTDYLIVGLQNIAVVRNKAAAKSIKITLAERLRGQGRNIRIISQSRFKDCLK